nr:hypothetical protein CJLB15_00055 [Campylobacter phage CJLB-15]
MNQNLNSVDQTLRHGCLRFHHSIHNTFINYFTYVFLFPVYLISCIQKNTTTFL